MKKLNAIVYNKLVLQAEEAKNQKMTKLANGLFEAIQFGPMDDSEDTSYASIEMNEDVYSDLWRAVTAVLKYHDVTSVDAEKIDEVIELFASKFINSVEETLGIEKNKIGPLEPAVLGQSK